MGKRTRGYGGGTRSVVGETGPGDVVEEGQVWGRLPRTTVDAVRSGRVEGGASLRFRRLICTRSGC